MDGFAIASSWTSNASCLKPAIFRTIGKIAAGQECDGVSSTYEYDEHAQPCLEIMTGGHFPTTGALSGLDACVKLEDVVHTKFDRQCNRAIKYVKVASPVRRGTNRRVAGGDMAKSQLIVRAGQRIQSSHILPLASAGNSRIEIERRLRVGIWSTGTEHTRGDASIVDVNGPYLQAACAEYGVEPEFLGYLDNDAEIVAEPFEQRSSWASTTS
ncbi:hypothetical protein PLICBS_001193 [Purpureocillium lilacinum]|uniref:uncharacterized protein n=1 Tax=Purpureocillium lilacinum TaxID=33203 RepID=UPI00207EA62A|nr:hypothetical protein PLICBS_001193 [Purpureocillium lilacinum]